MKDGLIVVFYAEDAHKRGGNNIQNEGSKSDTYYKNAVCTLISAKYHNPNTDVALITNTSVPEEYSSILTRGGILTFIETYDDFVFDDCPWTLSFFRFCALSKILKNHKQYNKIIMLECDMYVQSNLDDIFLECDHNILLHDLEHSLENKSYKGFLDEVQHFIGEKKYMTQYEGGFLAINRKDAEQFDIVCRRIYKKMIKDGFMSKYGDMFILSIAADEMRDRIKNAAGYVHIFWTGWFRSVSTRYEKDPVYVLHVPDEKERGMIKIYDFIKRGKVLDNEKVWKILRLKRMDFSTFIRVRIRHYIE